MSESKEIRENIRKYLASLDDQQTIEEQVKNLKEVTANWRKARSNNFEFEDLFGNSKLVVCLTKVLEENAAMYTKEWQPWVGDIMGNMWTLRQKDYFSAVQIKNLILALKKYVLCGYPETVSQSMRSMAWMAAYSEGKIILLHENEIYEVLKRNLSNQNALLCLRNLGSHDSWQIKILSDSKLISDLIALPESPNMWSLVRTISMHADAKTLLSKEVIAKASKSSNPMCVDICTLLCSENDLQNFQVSSQWILTKRGLLESKIQKGTANIGNEYYAWDDLIFPLANLSTVDALKERLGKELASLLIQALEKNASTRDKQETSRALWNLAYLESNRKLITESNGIQKLKQAMGQIDDPITFKNIEGILHMFETAPPPAVAPPSYAKGQGHVMISYNWGNQPLVLRLAKTLQNSGYNVWLDVEQMAGSTLGAMAEAIEGAELVLICMSQKYKDSPNCRLEGEYTINRKVPFVPLMMQQGYRADGWLGLALGSKLWYDFTSEDNWDSKVAGLFKEIGERGKKGAKDSAQSAVPAPAVPAAPTAPIKKSVADWTEEEVHEWMKTEHIEHYRELFAKHKINGRALAELKRLQNPNKPYFLFQVGQQLGISEVGEVLLLSSALQKLQ